MRLTYLTVSLDRFKSDPDLFFYAFALDTERYAGQAIVHFASSLQDAVGPRFQFPSLEFFAEFWLDESGERI